MPSNVLDAGFADEVAEGVTEGVEVIEEDLKEFGAGEQAFNPISVTTKATTIVRIAFFALLRNH